MYEMLVAEMRKGSSCYFVDLPISRLPPGTLGEGVHDSALRAREGKAGRSKYCQLATTHGER